MITQRGLNPGQFTKPENIRETFYNFYGLVVEAKQNDHLDDETFDELNQSKIKPVERIVKAMGTAQARMDQKHEEANKYKKLSLYLDDFINGGDALEKNRASFSLLVKELVDRYPYDVNLRALHTNLMSEKPGTHQPVYKVAELKNLVMHVMGAAYQQCRENQGKCLREAELAKGEMERHIHQFNTSFNDMKMGVMREVQAGVEKKNAAIKAEATLIIQSNLKEVKTTFSKLISKEIDIMDFIAKSHLNRATKLTLIEQFDAFDQALKENNGAKAMAAAQAIIAAYTQARHVTISDAFLLRELNQNFEYFYSVLDKKQKLENNQIPPMKILEENIERKAGKLLYNAKESLEFFERYAKEVKEAKLTSSYTDKKGNLSGKFALLMKQIHVNIESRQYKNSNEVDRDIRALDALKNEYQQILREGRDSSWVFKPKGTGTFATHLEKQMSELRNQLEDLHAALDSSNKFKR